MPRNDEHNDKHYTYRHCAERSDKAIQLEKQIKGGLRNAKLKLIERMNSNWEDFYDELTGLLRQ